MRIILSGGGTGGHIYPALALARHILKREEGAELLYVGTAAGLESKIVPEAGIPFVAIPARGYSRRLSQLGPVVKEFASGLARVQSIIRDFRPQAVLGTGGYAAAPVLLASIWRRIPVVLHEQNAIPGAVNRYLAPFASRVCLSFEASRPYFPRRARTVVTGNPRASEVAAVDRSESRRRLKLEADTKLVIAYGGSRGAAKLNQVLVSFIKSGWLPPRVRLIYVTGEIYYKEVREELDPLPGQVQLYPYLKEMPTFLGGGSAHLPQRRHHPGGDYRPGAAGHPGSFAQRGEQPPALQRQPPGGSGGGPPDPGKRIQSPAPAPGAGGSAPGGGAQQDGGGEQKAGDSGFRGAGLPLPAGSPPARWINTTAGKSAYNKTISWRSCQVEP
ncbi:MAG TPA: UDP-N-acetylglucosamine--N-acetylmuramyl-(pentapeptide) pyrophosphoryl-undecaprenol N-acetylglucosamine transferase [Bacillota bacterium]|nr:UDP-N-acetylglucosamine--N-acetylmuramyl-(pentapeptide) pyrophosphoryl-undecaprenol N-acetylglucosamine transferase [Bacillota bacterium]